MPCCRIKRYADDRPMFRYARTSSIVMSAGNSPASIFMPADWKTLFLRVRAFDHLRELGSIRCSRAALHYGQKNGGLKKIEELMEILKSASFSGGF
jgi:hypothetical protein